MYHRFMNATSGKQWQKSATAPGWDFLTNHAHVLTCVANDPGIRLRDIAAAVGITERAAHRILSELVEEGYVLRERRGRRNHYQVVRSCPCVTPSSPSARSGICSRCSSAHRGQQVSRRESLEGQLATARLTVSGQSPRSREYLPRARAISGACVFVSSASIALSCRMASR